MYRLKFSIEDQGATIPLSIEQLFYILSVHNYLLVQFCKVVQCSTEVSVIDNVKITVQQK